MFNEQDMRVPTRFIWLLIEVVSFEHASEPSDSMIRSS